MIHEHVINRKDIGRGCSAGVVSMAGEQVERNQVNEAGGGCV